MQQHSFAPHVLREYDIRGVVGTDLTAADAYAVGRAFAAMVIADGGRRIAVGYDGRLTSAEFETAVVDGMCDAGAEVLRIGRGPTPMLYFSVYELEADGGVMVTGSHNPPDYNGFKLTRGPKAFYGAAIQELGRIASAGTWCNGEGAAREVEVKAAYLERLAAALTGDAALAVGWDCGNGASGDVLPELVARLPGRHEILNAEVDGTFPAHHPDPTVPENLVQLQDLVAREGLQFGIAFDGDGDRLGVIDGRGRILWGDQILALLARDVLRERPGATVIADVKASQVLFDEIARAGGAPLMYRTGHSLIKDKMVETGAPLAGEMSGHLFFADRYFGFDDALYAAVRFLDAVGRAGGDVAAMRDSLPETVSTPEVRFDCDDARKFAVIADVQARLRAAGADVNDIDGVRVTTPDGWWLLRASNTQPVLVARCEAGDADGLARLKDAVRATLAESGITAPDSF